MAIRVVEFSSGGTKLKRLLPKNHEYFRACLVMFTAPNWHTLGIMVITQFNHIIAFF